MSTSSDNSGDSPKPPEKSTVILLISDIGDVTWRMFVPTIGLALGGVYLDRQLDTGPWIMLLGASIGAVIAGILIKKQLQRVNNR
ncbi:AtpZ/AtpI family protein [Candidatus Saccharibacteria bacterium]|nr:AtpZ/AtpI family protein [Candidatus Saccharibacteria bacterium]